MGTQALEHSPAVSQDVPELEAGSEAEKLGLKPSTLTQDVGIAGGVYSTKRPHT